MVRIGKVWWRQQDSLISGAEMLTFGSGACSVTVVTGHTRCAVQNAPSRLLQTPTTKEKPY